MWISGMNSISDPRAFLVSLFDAADAAADPLRIIKSHLPDKPKGRTVVIGAGKGLGRPPRRCRGDTLWLWRRLRAD